MSIDAIPFTPGRRIEGMSAVFLPHSDPQRIDWGAFEALLARVIEAGLKPAVNMDTGFTQLLSASQRAEVMRRTSALAGSGFVAGAFVDDAQGERLNIDAYRRATAAILEHGAIPVVFPSWGLSALEGNAWVDALTAITDECERFIAFELGPMFVPYGRIYDLDTYRLLMQLPNCIGAKHSSLSRSAEWRRLALRDAERPDFRVFTGNDLAIDMVMYGSDYLLGLSTFAPDAFALRDRYWGAGDERFFELNDVLQYLGAFSFRPPVPAYRHDAAMFLELRGWTNGSAVPRGAPERPESDRAVLAGALERLEALL